jgi:hypothetical protein
MDSRKALVSFITCFLYSHLMGVVEILPYSVAKTIIKYGRILLEEGMSINPPAISSSVKLLQIVSAAE